MTMIETAQHTAHLDPLTGVGILVLPPPGEDVWLETPGRMESLTGSDWDSMLRKLDARGWTLVEGEDGEPWLTVGTADDGRVGVALHCLSPIDEDVDPDVWCGAETRLLGCAGLRVSA